MSARDESYALDKIRASKSAPARTARTALEYLRAELGTMRVRGQPKHHLDKVRAEAFDALRLDIQESNAMEAEALRAEVAKLAKAHESAYERDAARLDRLVANYQRRFMAMSSSELVAEVRKAMAGGYQGVDALARPYVLDELSAAVRGMDEGAHDELRAYLRKVDYSEPWMETPEARALASRLRAHEVAGDNVVVEDEGRFFTLSLVEVDGFLRDEAERQEGKDD